MPQRQNLKPALADTLRALRNDVQSGATVPHGVKTVEPGEGLQLVPPEGGAEIFWDWETANTWDTRIQEGRAAIEQARADLDKAEQDLAAGAARVDENRALLDALGPRVESAESTVAQASKDLTALQSTVGDVAAKAAASEQKATDALSKAGAAQTSADGKTTITRALEPRTTQKGGAVGDTHFTMSSMGGGGLVLRQQRWDGSIWQDEALSHQVLASLDLGKATVGELDGGRIRAGTVTADRLLVGIGDNLAPDPNFQVPAAWTTPAWVDPKASGYRTTGSLVLPASTSQRGAYMTTRGALPASRRARFSVWVKSATPLAVNDIRVFARAYKQDGTWVFMTPSFVGNTDPIPAGTWARVVGEFAGPEDGATFTVGMFAQPSTGTVTFSEFQMTGLTEGALIVNGSITGKQLQGESVAAEVVRSMTAEHRNLVVTESAILQHTTLLGTTVADELNVRKLIRGRDAILDGTVDVAQLNVTGAMSAEIVRAMDIQARRGIFTEGLTAQDATLLGTTVAETLNAETVAARIMTSGLLQTTTAANRGVKIDNNGIRAWDSSGRQTVQLNGTSNYITGSFSTAETGQRVRIRNASTVAGIDFFASNNTDDHLGIWYDSPDSNVLNAVAKIQAMTSVQNTRENPALFMWPMRGTFGFQGRWGQDTDATKFVVLTNFAGLGPGAYNTITINYQSAFPTNNSLRCPFVSVESATGADVMATVVQQTESNIRINIINQSGGKSSGTIVLRVVTFNINA